MKIFCKLWFTSFQILSYHFLFFPRVFLSDHFKWLNILSILPCWTHLLYLLHSRCIYAWTDHLTFVKYKKRGKVCGAYHSTLFKRTFAPFVFRFLECFLFHPSWQILRPVTKVTQNLPGVPKKKIANLYQYRNYISFFKFNAFQGLLLLDIIHLCEEPYLCFPISHQVVNAIVKGNCILHAL